MRDQRGMILVLGLLMLLLITLLGLAAVNASISDLKVTGNYRAAVQAFLAAESGLEDVRSRLAQTSAQPIQDTAPNKVDWVVAVGTAQRYGERNLSIPRCDPLRPATDYFVIVRHKTQDDPPRVLYWGDENEDGKPEENTTTGRNIYEVLSEGFTHDEGRKSLRAEFAKVPSVTVPGAVYTKANTTIGGSSTQINGRDGCGTSDRPAVVSRGSINTNGSPVLDGSPVDVEENSLMNLDLLLIAQSLKDYATSLYNTGGTYTGMHWGTPSLPVANEVSSCGEHNIVYFTQSVKLSGGTTGCGILIVEGDLEVNGGFLWHGLMIATGAIRFSGGGEKNITGAVLSGSEIETDVISGNTVILFCSGAARQTDFLPLTLLSWKELY
jgi:hypothetical protein